MSSVVQALCKLYGPLLNLPGDLDGRKVMWAISGNESSFGKNDAPRYEKSFDVGGPNYRKEQIALVSLWPKDEQGRSLAAFSYGPWQILPCNAMGYTLRELRDDPAKGAESFVARINEVGIPHFNVATLDDVAQFWNSGHIQTHPAPGVARYVEDALHYYQTAEFQ